MRRGKKTAMLLIALATEYRIDVRDNLRASDMELQQFGHAELIQPGRFGKTSRLGQLANTQYSHTRLIIYFLTSLEVCRRLTHFPWSL